MLQTLAGRRTPSCDLLERTRWLPTAEALRPNIVPIVRSAKESIELVPYGASDRDAAFDLLHELPILYPGGDKWLETRLLDVLSGKAECTMARIGHRTVGILIGTPKGRRRVKLSTIYVHPHYRRRHVATSLLDMSRTRWMEQGIDLVTVTVRTTRMDSLARTLRPYGFNLTHIERNRYGESRHEAILVSALHGS